MLVGGPVTGSILISTEIANPFRSASLSPLYKTAPDELSASTMNNLLLPLGTSKVSVISVLPLSWINRWIDCISLAVMLILMAVISAGTAFSTTPPERRYSLLRDLNTIVIDTDVAVGVVLEDVPPPPPPPQLCTLRASSMAIKGVNINVLIFQVAIFQFFIIILYLMGTPLQLSRV